MGDAAFQQSHHGHGHRNADGDRFSDAAEFAAGTDPRDAASWLRIVAQDFDLTTGKLDFTSVTNRLYRIEHTTDLAGI